MQIEIKARNTEITEAVRKHAERHLAKVSKQVSELARCELELIEERNPSIADDKVAEATLHLKGVILRARCASPDMAHSVDKCADNLARQVKRHREKRRGAREPRPDKAEPAAS